MRFDVAIIGAGVVGALTARELSKWNIRTALLEKENDVAMGASKANSALVHAGYDALPGTLKAKLNVEGSKEMHRVCGDLSVPLKQIGSLVVAFSEEEKRTLPELLERGRKNQVPGLELVSRERLREMEPNIGPEAVGALWAPTAAITCPYELTIAATENAVANGVTYFRNCGVSAIVATEDGLLLHTPLGEIEAACVINAAGVYAGEIAEMLGDDSVRITPRRGEYLLLDKSMGGLARHILFQCPGTMGKGVLVTPTVDGNLLLGPTAAQQESMSDVSTTMEGLEEVKRKALKTLPSIRLREVITSFSGLRAHGDTGDFILRRSETDSRMVHAAAIESPGLSASPAIAKEAEKLALEVLGDAKKRESFCPIRPAPVRFRELTPLRQKELVEKDRRYGRVICRCETVTEGEILDAIHAPAGARDVDGVKRRTRAGMGRCQSGFCGSKVVELLARELKLPMEEITKDGGASRLLLCRTKGGALE